MSALSKLLDELTGRQAEQNAAIARGRREIVSDLCDDKQVDPDDVEHIRSEMGFTHEQMVVWLKAENAKEKRRRQLRDSLARKPDFLAQQAAGERELALGDEEDGNRRRAWQEKRKALAENLEEIAGQLARFANEEVELRELAHPEQVEIAKVHESELMSANCKLQFLKEQLGAFNSKWVRTGGPAGESFVESVTFRKSKYAAIIRQFEQERKGDRNEYEAAKAGLKESVKEEARYRREMVETEALIKRLSTDPRANATLEV